MLPASLALTYRGKAPPVIPGGAKRREGNPAFRRAASARFLDPLPSAFGLAGDDRLCPSPDGDCLAKTVWRNEAILQM